MNADVLRDFYTCGCFPGRISFRGGVQATSKDGGKHDIASLMLHGHGRSACKCSNDHVGSTIHAMSYANSCRLVLTRFFSFSSSLLLHFCFNPLMLHIVNLLLFLLLLSLSPPTTMQAAPPSAPSLPSASPSPPPPLSPLPLSWRKGLSPTFIHCNAAGASPSSQPCHDALVDHLSLEREIGGYAAASKVLGGSKSREAPHASLGKLFGCPSRNVAVVESAQRGWNLALNSLPLSTGTTVLCFSSEYAGNAVSLLALCERTGAALRVLPTLPSGTVNVPALEAALAELSRAASSGASPSEASPTVVALTHVNTDSSVIQPAGEVGAVCAAFGAVYLLDSCQSVGCFPVDVTAIGCDFAVATGRKWLRGPR